MMSLTEEEKQILKDIVKSTGAVAVGVAEAAPVSDSAFENYRSWLESGFSAGMEYMWNHSEIRRDPRLLLDGAESVVSVAFSFNPVVKRDKSLPAVASYAYGRDYHDVVRKRLSEAVNALKERFGGEYRICVDSAPIMERYWAMKSGIGRMGENGAVIIDGYGSMVFLAEIVTTLAMAADEPSERRCCGCGECRKACPGKAIGENGIIDSRRCISYLTIEHRGEWNGTGEEVMKTPAGRRSLYGCEICLAVCPHNRDIPTTKEEEFLPVKELLMLDIDGAKGMTQERFSSLFRGSAVKRCKLAGFLRNARNLS